jgi:hypothetical protein
MADNVAHVDVNVGKAEHEKDDASPRDSSSIASSPEADVEPGPQEQHQTQKRKGGRKPVSSFSAGYLLSLSSHCSPASLKGMSRMSLIKRSKIYATSEERKQRNRAAQAAFRERRTEYIKQLETTIKHHEDALQSLQQSHRSAADECLMLRYKNSLLERILLEKGAHTSVGYLAHYFF